MHYSTVFHMHNFECHLFENVMRDMCMPVVYGFGLSHFNMHEQKNRKILFKNLTFIF